MAFRLTTRRLAAAKSAVPRRPSREDKFMFDLNGFFQLRGALSTDEVNALNEGIDTHLEDHAVERASDALKNTKVGTGMSASGSRIDLGGMLSWEGKSGAAFRALLCHPKCKPFLEAFVGVGYRLDHQPLCLVQGKDSEGFHLHGGPVSESGHFNPELQYRCEHGAIWNSLVGMSVSLVDQSPGDGGFCILPGSHKTNFPLPPDFRHGDSDEFSEFIHIPETKAGDVIFFSEATIHGALPWRSLDKQRRIALFRFAPPNMGYGRAYTESWGDHFLEDKCSKDEWAVLQPPYAPRMDRQLVGRNLEARSEEKKAHDRRIFGTDYF